jgi:hypothetical protein
MIFKSNGFQRIHVTTGLERRNGGSALHANGTETPLGAGTKDVQVFIHQRMAQQALA